MRGEERQCKRFIYRQQRTLWSFFRYSCSRSEALTDEGLRCCVMQAPPQQLRRATGSKEDPPPCGKGCQAWISILHRRWSDTSPFEELLPTPRHSSAAAPRALLVNAWTIK